MLIDIATASPPFKVPQERAAEELKKRMSDRPATARMIDSVARHSGIETRNFVIPDGDDTPGEKFFTKDGAYIKPDTKQRMEEYEKWSKLLAVEAVRKVLAATQCPPEKINWLITISCTGFYAPGLDYFLINELQIPRSVKRTHIGFMGCAASLIGFNVVHESMSEVTEGEDNVLLVSVELCSLHLQTESSKDNILANLLFADGAAAALFSSSAISFNRSTALEFIGTDSLLFENSAEFMGWKIGNFGFEMMLSPELPRMILEEAVPALIKILEAHGTRKEAIRHWALHPGGRAILDSLQTGLMLTDEQMLPSREVLKNFGNMSSASILFVLKEALQTQLIQKGELCCAVAFGPGLSMEVALFKSV